MTLGDIFGWLGRISLHSIFKWWGILAVSLIMACAFLFVTCLLGWVVWFFISVVPWPLLVLFVFVLGGLFAAHSTLNNDMEEEFWK